MGEMAEQVRSDNGRMIAAVMGTTHAVRGCSKISSGDNNKIDDPKLAVRHV